jgi:hypothetical protein
MTTFPGSPRVVRGGIVLVDPDSGVVQRVVVLQYNPDTMTRTLQVKGAPPEAGDRLEATRLIGPPAETIKVDAEIDATDQLEFPDQNPTAVELGIHPQLAALETIVYPSSRQMQTNNSLARAGVLEIIPLQAPLALFVWSRNRILPVHITEFNITEEAFDPSLNPVRAKVSLGMRVLTINDVNFGTKAGSIYMAYFQRKEQLAGKSPEGTLSALGVTRIV